MASSCCAGFISRVPHILCAVGTDDCWFKRWESGDAFVLLYFIQMLKVKRFIDCLKHIVGPWAVIYRWQQAIPPKMDLVKKVFVFLNFAYTVLVLNYSCVGFMVFSFTFISLLSSHQAKILTKQMFIVFSVVIPQVLSLHETLVAYGSVNFIGTIVPIVVILLGYVIKPARPSRSKARKEQWVETTVLASHWNGQNEIRKHRGLCYLFWNGKGFAICCIYLFFS